MHRLAWRRAGGAGGGEGRWDGGGEARMGDPCRGRTPLSGHGPATSASHADSSPGACGSRAIRPPSGLPRPRARAPGGRRVRAGAAEPRAAGGRELCKGAGGGAPSAARVRAAGELNPSARARARVCFFFFEDRERG